MFYKKIYMWSLSDGNELGMTSLLDRDLVRLNRNGHWGWRLHFCLFILYVLIIKKMTKMTTRMPDPVCE